MKLRIHHDLHFLLLKNLPPHLKNHKTGAAEGSTSKTKIDNQVRRLQLSIFNSKFSINLSFLRKVQQSQAGHYAYQSLVLIS